MERISRISCLSELLEGIFDRTTIGYENYEPGKRGTLVQNKNGLFDKNTYTQKYKQRFDVLFDIAFNTESVDFDVSNSKWGSDYNRERLINNAVLYFRHYDIEVPNYYENSHDRRMLSREIYKVIVSEILPVIFDIDNDIVKKEKVDLDSEDVTVEFYTAIHKVKKIFESANFAEIMYANAIGKDIEFIYNRSEKLDRCNYFKLYSTERYYSYHDYNPFFMIQIKELQNDNTLITSASELKDKFFNSVIEETITKSELDNQPIYLPKGENSIYRFRILNSIHPCCYLPRFFYYTKEITQDLLSSKYSDYSDKYRFEKRISDEAHEALYNKYRYQFDAEESNFFRSIMEVLNQISNISYDGIIVLFKHKTDTNHITDSIMRIIIDIIECLRNYGIKPESIVCSIITAIDYSVNSFCDLIENYYFRSSKDQRTKSWNMGFLITALYDEERSRFLDSIEKISGRIEKINQERVLLGCGNHIYPEINDNDLKLSIILGDSSKNRGFVPFKALEYDPFKRLQKILLDIAQLLKEG
ncbi:MAG: hypothetical protein IKO47_00030 [Ruminococcus sp.]|nr:hypothetical protein [Ruminococcus sp.]